MLLVPLEFYDAGSERMMKLDYMPSTRTPWLFYRHRDGQWVTLREPTDDDIDALEAVQAGVVEHGREETVKFLRRVEG